jgi:hypothetical protein
LKYINENAHQGVAPSVRGLDIACRFFWEIGLPAIESEFPAYVDRLAAGLIAAGSDCSDNDDEVSRDQDWGPRFQAYLTESDFAEIGAELQLLLDDLPKVFGGAQCRHSGPHSNHVFSVDGFLLEMTSDGASHAFARAPESSEDWLEIPEHRLFDLTHGQVFYDPLGEFSDRRKDFFSYYPDDAWYSKLAGALSECGEHGQGLLPRALARGDYYTAEMTWWRFCESAMRLGFLLSRRYAPSSQWLYREFCKLPGHSVDVTNLLWDGQCDITRRYDAVDLIARVYGKSIAGLGLETASEACFSQWADEIRMMQQVRM